MAEAIILSEGILHLLGSLQKNKAHEPEYIANRIMKECSGILFNVLRVLYNRFLPSGRFYIERKCANIVPVHKSSPKDRVMNYMPISLLFTSFKIMERIVYIINHLSDERLFTSSKHGFRKGCSCQTLLLEFYHDFASSYDRGNQIDCLLGLPKGRYHSRFYTRSRSHSKVGSVWSHMHS